MSKLLLDGIKQHQVVQQIISRPPLRPNGHWSLLGNQSVRERSLRLIRSSGHLCVSPGGGQTFQGHTVEGTLYLETPLSHPVGGTLHRPTFENASNTKHYWDTLALASPIFNYLVKPLSCTLVRFPNPCFWSLNFLEGHSDMLAHCINISVKTIRSQTNNKLGFLVTEGLPQLLCKFFECLNCYRDITASC